MSKPIGQAKVLPLYVQISELLTREIAAGHWLNGERLPTEAELAVKLGVAVGTLRKALADLEGRGLLERRQGSGTYVRTPAGERSIYELFRLELLDGGGLPTAQVISLDRLAHPPGVPRFGDPTADLARGEAGSGSPPTCDATAPACYRVRRLRLLNLVAVALEEIWFDARHADTRLTRPLGVDDLNESLYFFYQHDLGFWISHVEDHVTLGQVPAWAPAGFAVTPGAPVCQVERRSWSQAETLEEYSTTWVDPARARYAARWR